ncbi:MAG: beta-glucoside-specific PTS transporter subunit IIABC, partial [Eubacteriales bacterium]
MNYRKTAEEIIEKVGGRDNIRTVTHCMTRLRLILENEASADDKAVEEIDGVLKVIRQGGQYQVIIGKEVRRVFAEIQSAGIHTEGISGTDAKDSDKKKGGPISRLLGYIAGSMTPLLPAMLGGGMVKVLLTLMTTFKLISDTSSTYRILDIAGDAIFCFLPIMLAYTIAKRQGSSQILAMLIAGILLHPNLTALFSNGDTTFFGIPVISANYPSSVLPVLLIVPIMKYIEIFADRISPNIVKIFLKPLIVILLTTPLALIVIGPIGAILGNYLAEGVHFLYSRVGWLTLLLLAALMPFIVLTGMHHALIPLCTMSLAGMGYDPILSPALFCSNLAQGGASLAVAIKTKDRSMKQIATGASVSALIAGVTEPAMYGVTIKLKKPLIAACIAAGMGGLYAGLTGVVVYARDGTPSLFTLISMSGGDRYRTLINGLITLFIVMLLSFILTLFFCRDKSPKHGKSKHDKSKKEEVKASAPAEVAETTTVLSPMNGKVLPLSSVADATFASGVLGKGCAIEPYEGHLYAPVDGTVDNLFDTLHAIALKGKDGVELLMHIGRDTVELGGKFFKAYCKNGDAVKAGDLLIDFDMDGLKKAGYDLITPIIVVNSDSYESVGTVADGKTDVGA